MNELLRALAVLAEPPAPEHERVAASLGLDPPRSEEYADIFLQQLYPYASVYAGAEGMLGGEARDRVAGFWRALGLVPPAEPDHLTALLGLLAALEAPEHRRALLWEHLLSWLSPWLAKLDEIAPPAYRAWGRLLGTALEEEARALGPLEGLPLHLRAAPPLEHDDLLGGVLVPVRSGVLLVRDDLAHAARELGLGVRIAERRYVLRALLAQDAAPTLAWLAAEARRWAGLHAERPGPIGEFWQERAEAAAALLDDACTAAREREVAHA
ncbi:MAG TPA: molecular chaperone TorD family protein [Gaiellaceae bacterium]|nr:molecular chaperone TorD family protein [Gaiellaceae bacterium]